MPLIEWDIYFSSLSSRKWDLKLNLSLPYQFFQSSHGLRQGFPPSPFLIILMAECFSRALDHKCKVGLITGIKFSNGVKNMNHSQFADDTILKGRAPCIIAHRFKSLLDKFILYSGGLINHHKSCIYGWNVANHTIHSIAQIFGVSYKLNWAYFNYLGMPVSAGPLKSEVWNITIDKMKKRVQQWGSSSLNMAGHLILLKYFLSSLPLYYFNLFNAYQHT